MRAVVAIPALLALGYPVIGNGEVFRVVARQCKPSDAVSGSIPKVRIATGFEIENFEIGGRPYTGLVTAFHAVAARCKSISAVVFKQSNELAGVVSDAAIDVPEFVDLKVAHVDLDNDLAILTGTRRGAATKKIHHSACPRADEIATGDDGHATGYPRGSFVRQRFPYVVSGLPALGYLANLSPETAPEWQAWGYPSRKVLVLPFVGPVASGMSGSPIVRSDGKLLGVVDGVIANSNGTIQWATLLCSANFSSVAQVDAVLDKLENVPIPSRAVSLISPGRPEDLEERVEVTVDAERLVVGVDEEQRRTWLPGVGLVELGRSGRAQRVQGRVGVEAAVLWKATLNLPTTQPGELYVSFDGVDAPSQAVGVAIATARGVVRGALGVPVCGRDKKQSWVVTPFSSGMRVAALGDEETRAACDAEARPSRDAATRAPRYLFAKNQVVTYAPMSADRLVALADRHRGAVVLSTEASSVKRESFDEYSLQAKVILPDASPVEPHIVVDTVDERTVSLKTIGLPRERPLSPAERSLPIKRDISDDVLTARSQGFVWGDILSPLSSGTIRIELDGRTAGHAEPATMANNNLRDWRDDDLEPDA